jgi:hypothetical protein
MAREAPNIAALLEQINQTSPQLKRAWASFDIARLTELREKIITLLNMAAEVAETGAMDALEGESTRKFLDGVAGMEKLLNMLDSLTVFKHKISLDSAVEKVLASGYRIRSGEGSKAIEMTADQYIAKFKNAPQE